MHRNTYLLVSVLAVVAALVIGVNVGRNVTNSDTDNRVEQVPSVTQAPLEASTMRYQNAFCKVEFDYPASLAVFESASGSAAFTGANAGEGILLTCQQNIPRPDVGEENTEEVRIGSVAATLYRDSVDSLIFRHPATKLDVFIASAPQMLQKIIETLRTF